MEETHSFIIKIGGTTMRNYISCFILCLVIILTGCAKHSKPDSTNSGKLLFYSSFDVVKLSKADNWIEASLSTIGIKKPIIAEQTTLTIDEASYAMYLIYDKESFIDTIYHQNSYIAVEKNSHILLVTIDDGSYADKLYACDIDGDGTDEIVIQQTIGMSGGAGQYLSTVIKVVDNEFFVIFRSSPDDLFDTGFSCTMHDRFTMKIDNRFTEYEETISFMNNPKYVGIYFDENGKSIRSGKIWCDSFCEFYPKDVDSDGISEILCSQYVSLNGHSDNVGYARSILKFCSYTNEFQVVTAEFDYCFDN